MRTFSSVLVGRYFPASSPLHKADPRLKIVLLFALISSLFAAVRWEAFLAIFLLIALFVILSKLPVGWIIRSLRPAMFIILFTLVIHFFFTPGPPMARLGPITISEIGFNNGLFLSARFLMLIISALILTFTTSPIELTDGLEWLFGFLKKVKVPVHELAMMMTIAIRFIPTLIIEAERIMKAQVSRGADFESGSLIKRGKNIIALLIPLFIGVFERADELALAMEARCYRGGEGRTRMKPLKMSSSDYFFGLFLLFLIGLITILGRR